MNPLAPARRTRAAGHRATEHPAAGPVPGRGARAALVGVAVALAGCVVSGAVATRVFAQPAPVPLWVPARGGYLDDWRAAAALAARLEPGVAIEVQPIWADYWARLTLALAEGRAPGLVVVDPEIAVRLASRGWLADASRAAVARGLEVALAPFTWQGRVYAVPGFADPAMLYLNVDVLRRAGVQPDAAGRTWESLLGTARRVAALPDRVWGFPVNGWPPLEWLVLQAGGYVVRPSGQLWDDIGPVVQAARLYRTFVVEGLSPAPPQSWQQTLDVYFREGRAALIVGLYSDPLDQPGRLSSPFESRAARTPVGPSGRPVGWFWVEGVAAPAPSRPGAQDALAAMARALRELGPLPPSARRPGAEAVALHELKSGSAPGGLEGYLEFSAAWWRHVVEPLLTLPEPLDVRELVARARPHLQAALAGGALP